ncbi:putative serine/threonine/dual specificity protein kinase, catalytic domain-containing protein [Tanacetum coccineum]
MGKFNEVKEVPKLNLLVLHPCRRFSLATNNFDPETIIGKGGFGKVYKGFIDDGGTRTTIAIKCEFNEMMVVYEYISGGDLAKRLHKVNGKSIRTPLTFVERSKICIGAAQRQVSDLGLLKIGLLINRVLFKCLQNQPKDRPTMSEVVVDLEAALALQERGEYLVRSR